ALVRGFTSPTVAIPLLFVDCEPPVIEPPPPVTANVTETPGTGFPKESVTSTDGAVDTFVFTVADCPLPALSAIVCAAAAEIVNAELAAAGSAPEAACNW